MKPSNKTVPMFMGMARMCQIVLGKQFDNQQLQEDFCTVRLEAWDTVVRILMDYEYGNFSNAKCHEMIAPVIAPPDPNFAMRYIQLGPDEDAKEQLLVELQAQQIQDFMDHILDKLLVIPAHKILTDCILFQVIGDNQIPLKFSKEALVFNRLSLEISGEHVDVTVGNINTIQTSIKALEARAAKYGEYQTLEVKYDALKARMDQVSEKNIFDSGRLSKNSSEQFYTIAGCKLVIIHENLAKELGKEYTIREDGLFVRECAGQIFSLLHQFVRLLDGNNIRFLKVCPEPDAKLRQVIADVLSRCFNSIRYDPENDTLWCKEVAEAFAALFVSTKVPKGFDKIIAHVLASFRAFNGYKLEKLAEILASVVRQYGIFNILGIYFLSNEKIILESENREYRWDNLLLGYDESKRKDLTKIFRSSIKKWKDEVYKVDEFFVLLDWFINQAYSVDVDNDQKELFEGLLRQLLTWPMTSLGCPKFLSNFNLEGFIKQEIEGDDSSDDILASELCVDDQDDLSKRAPKYDAQIKIGRDPLGVIQVADAKNNQNIDLLDAPTEHVQHKLKTPIGTSEIIPLITAPPAQVDFSTKSMFLNTEDQELIDSKNPNKVVKKDPLKTVKDKTPDVVLKANAEADNNPEQVVEAITAHFSPEQVALATFLDQEERATALLPNKVVQAKSVEQDVIGQSDSEAALEPELVLAATASASTENNDDGSESKK